MYSFLISKECLKVIGVLQKLNRSDTSTMDTFHKSFHKSHAQVFSHRIRENKQELFDPKEAR